MADRSGRRTVRQVVADALDLAPEDVTADDLDPVIMFLRSTMPDPGPVEGGGWLLDSMWADAVRSYLAQVGPEGEELDDDPWAEFVDWARMFFEWEDFEADERTYKLEIARKIGLAREAALVDSEEWPALVRRSFASPNNLTFHITHTKYLDWMDENPTEARQGLLTLWDTDRPLAERVDGFSAVLPTGLLASPSSRLQISSFLLMADPTEYVIYRPRPFKTAAELVEYDSFPDEPESAIYDHALGFVDRVLQESHDRRLALKDRLDAQSIIWAVARGDRAPAVMEPAQVEAFNRYRGTSPAVWWVNQGGSWQNEMEHGVLTAPMTSRAGYELQHHKNVSRLRKGDVIVHYWNLAVRAISVVSAKPTNRNRPWEPDGETVRTVKTTYFPLPEPITINDIDPARRLREGGVFDTSGTVKQVYLMPLSVGFSEWMRSEFRDRWPDGAPWAMAHKPTWLFQANPSIYALADVVAGMEVDEEDTFTVSRFRTEIANGDRVILWQAGPEAGVYGLGTVSGPIFERDEDEDVYATGGDRHAVAWKLTRKVEPPIRRSDLLTHPVLKGLSVITAPQGTNFRVTAEQWEELRRLIDGEPAAIAEPADDDTEFPSGSTSVEAIQEHLEKQGMTIDKRTLRRFHIALKTRGFVILSGISGTGKTWLTELYSAATGAEYHLEPVAPNWTTNEDLIGYHNPLDGVYHDTGVSNFLRRAADEFKEATEAQREPRKFLLTLDEMNLARVEYYFAKFLSLLEVRARRGSVDLQLGQDTITVGANVLFVGTVNVDETTHSFADKVFDRAQLLELTAPRDAVAGHIGSGDYADALLQVYDAVSKVRPFAFRVVEDIKEYIAESEALEVEWHEALDEQVLQKVLPKLSGAEPAIGQALNDLIEVAAQHNLVLTQEKAERMRNDYAQDGIASYF